jgi:hypothetical protein
MTQKPTLTREQTETLRKSLKLMVGEFQQDEDSAYFAEKIDTLCRGYRAYLDMVPRALAEIEGLALVKSQSDTETAWHVLCKYNKHWRTSSMGMSWPPSTIGIPLSALPTEGETL